jgi:hypothetical protein
MDTGANNGLFDSLAPSLCGEVEEHGYEYDQEGSGAAHGARGEEDAADDDGAADDGGRSRFAWGEDEEAVVIRVYRQALDDKLFDKMVPKPHRLSWLAKEVNAMDVLLTCACLNTQAVGAAGSMQYATSSAGCYAPD